MAMHLYLSLFGNRFAQFLFSQRGKHPLYIFLLQLHLYSGKRV